MALERMTTIGAYAAKTKLPELLRRVARGERFIITKHGRAVGQLLPPPRERTQSVGDVIQAMRELRKANRLRGLSLKALVREGRQ